MEEIKQNVNVIKIPYRLYFTPTSLGLDYDELEKLNTREQKELLDSKLKQIIDRLNRHVNADIFSVSQIAREKNNCMYLQLKAIDRILLLDQNQKRNIKSISELDFNILKEQIEFIKEINESTYIDLGCMRTEILEPEDYLSKEEAMETIEFIKSIDKENWFKYNSEEEECI